MMRRTKKLIKKVAIFPRTTYGFLKKDYSLLFKKKKYLYLSLFLPLLIGLIYVSTLSSNTQDITVFVCDYDNTAITNEAVNSMGFSFIKGIDSNCTQQLIQEVKDGHYLFGIIIEEGFTERLSNLQQSTLILYYDNSDPSVSSLASWKVDLALAPFKEKLITQMSLELKEKSRNAREKTTLALELAQALNIQVMEPITASIEEADRDLEQLQNLDVDYLVQPVLVRELGVYEGYSVIDVGIAPLYCILSLFLILMLCSTGIMYDRKVNLFQRIKASNSTFISYILAKLILFFSIALVIFFIILTIFVLSGAKYNVNPLLLLEAILFISLVNTLLGLLIGLISDSEGVAVLVSLTITLPMLFLSGMFYPLKLLPKGVQLLSKVMPLEIQVEMIKKALLFNTPIVSEYFIIPLVLLIMSLILLRKL